MKATQARWSILVLTATVLLAGLVVLSRPQILGYFTKEGEVPLLVGYEDKGMHRNTSPLWVFIKAKCIWNIDGLVPPYTSVTTYMSCLFPDDARLPARPMRLTIHGGRGEGVSNLPPIEAEPREYLRESYMVDNPIPGYRGILISPAPHKDTPGAHFLSGGRFIAMSDDAVVKQLQCILNWQVTGEGDRVIGGSCFGFGRYDDVVFDTAFAVDRELDEARVSALIRTAINQMLRM